jgi:hypothetical protein
MKLSNIALVSVALLGIAVVGCGARKNGDADDDGSLATTEQQLVEDDSEASATDDDVEAGLDEPLSGAEVEDPAAPPDAATEADMMERVRKNPGRFFRPAGCITTTIAGNVATHVFKDCTGPYQMAKFNGTVTSTWVREEGKLTVTHEAEGFTINGAQISGKRVVVYTRSGSVITKTRTGSWTGTTAKGNPISHEASFVSTYDMAAKCVTRDGTAKTSLAKRSFERTVDEYKRCGIGRLGCPESGKVVLTRTKEGESLSLTLEFLGGRDVRVTRPNGTEATRSLVCNPGN